MNWLKRRIEKFIRDHVVDPLSHCSAELIYQDIFNNQCLKAKIQNDFYPVAYAANYSLMYLVFRILNENQIESIVELGSGQTTLLIDRIKRPPASHICYEDDQFWFNLMKRRLCSVDYRYRELVPYRIKDLTCKWYSNVEHADFDLLLVDGPKGVDQYSRLGCSELVANNGKEDFVIVFDDSNRRGETQTIEYVSEILRRKGVVFKTSHVQGTKRQTVISSGKYIGVSSY